jgi:hypothetical protein
LIRAELPQLERSGNTASATVEVLNFTAAKARAILEATLCSRRQRNSTIGRPGAW